MSVYNWKIWLGVLATTIAFNVVYAAPEFYQPLDNFNFEKAIYECQGEKTKFRIEVTSKLTQDELSLDEISNNSLNPLSTHLVETMGFVDYSGTVHQFDYSKNEWILLDDRPMTARLGSTKKTWQLLVGVAPKGALLIYTSDIKEVDRAIYKMEIEIGGRSRPSKLNCTVLQAGELLLP